MRDIEVILAGYADQRRQCRAPRVSEYGDHGLGRRDMGERFFFSSRRRHTRFSRDWSSDVCYSDLQPIFERDDVVGAVGVEKAGLPSHSSRVEYGLSAAQSRIKRVGYDLVQGRVGNERIFQKAGKIGRASCREREKSGVGEEGVKRK